MKYYSRLGLYKASNVTFNPNTLEARSYQWWSFVTKVGNKVVFNNYCYSNTTRRHQSKVRRLMNELGIEIDFEVEVHNGLQTSNWPKEAKLLLQRQIAKLDEAIKRKGTKKAKNLERISEIELLNRKIQVVELLDKVVGV